MAVPSVYTGRTAVDEDDIVSPRDTEVSERYIRLARRRCRVGRRRDGLFDVSSFNQAPTPPVRLVAHLSHNAPIHATNRTDGVWW